MPNRDQWTADFIDAVREKVPNYPLKAATAIALQQWSEHGKADPAKAAREWLKARAAPAVKRP